MESGEHFAHPKRRPALDTIWPLGKPHNCSEQFIACQNKEYHCLPHFHHIVGTWMYTRKCTTLAKIQMWGAWKDRRNFRVRGKSSTTLPLSPCLTTTRSTSYQVYIHYCFESCYIIRMLMRLPWLNGVKGRGWGRCLEVRKAHRTILNWKPFEI